MMIRYVDGSLRDENGDLFLRSARECYDGVMIAPCARRASNASHVTDPSGDAGGCECGRMPMCVWPMAVLGIPRRGGTPIRLGGTRDTDGDDGVLDGGAAGAGARLSDAWGEEYRGGRGGHACAWETA
ncbi:hypothetical protein AGABI1DRAFT_111383 [Agaricus bisporus var. burnettii JB137-S8]|uniref:Uncharacterized protein n=1 Tax=Agaricus bisporus var. burnettii (strain JB137-S8 / ATCC MYA-4627 / FGSC 10392) TaxID=597362 RepID=K5Y472_AGABU|nr:uncharacterized protein AGABI1DRAFT_111383 [Agaricus bisporus var. burnettii JB137-S8]EKM82815.1 hypothetical protein AGABI1DRAFT_111383 [Agaricus bisporus var. burnettii JB137-S8]